MWIKDQSEGGMAIFTTVPRVAYYAGQNYEFIDFKKDRWDEVKASMEGKKAVYLVIQEKDIINVTGVAEDIKKNFIEVMQYEKKKMNTVIVYKRIE
jgi:hypothetical protein